MLMEEITETNLLNYYIRFILCIYYYSNLTIKLMLKSYF